MRIFLVAVALAMIGIGTAPAQDRPGWSYEGPNGPAAWGRLSPADALCGTGRQQSPIDLSDGEKAEMQALIPRYRITPLQLAVTRRGLSMSYRPGSRLVLGRWEYELKDIAFKMPSEHRVAGKRFDMEIQLRHQNARGDTAMIAVLVQRGSHRLALDEVSEHLPRGRLEGRIERADVLLNARDFLPFGGEYYRYMGSETTPPCREGVHWYVMKSPITASGAQLKRFRAVVDGISRPPQHRGNRMLLEATAVK